MSKELIAKARALAVTGGERDKTIRDLADLAESEGKRADEAERERAKSDAAYEALFKRTTTAINAMRTERDAALAELATLKGQQP